MTEDAAELAALRRRAYAPGAALSDDEVARLHAWEEQRRRERMPPALAEAVETEPTLEGLVAPAEQPATGPSEPAASDPVRRGPAALVIGGALLLCLGALLGWLIPAIPGWQAGLLSAAETESRAIAADVVGTEEDAVRLVARDDELLVWLAPRRDGAEMCVVVHHGDDNGMGCSSSEDYPRYGAAAGVDIDSGNGTEYVHVWVRDSIHGEPMVSIQRESIIGETGQSSWLDQFPEPYRATAQALVDAGYERQSPMIVGFDGEGPVWTASRGSQICLIIAGVNGGEVCAAYDDARKYGLTFSLLSDDPAEADSARVYTLRWGSEWALPTLTIENRSALALRYAN